MSVETMLSEYNSLAVEFEKKRREFVEGLKPNFHDLFLPFLEANPIVTRITFTAYTPYFNDGSECIYSVGEPMFHTDNETPVYDGFDSYSRQQVTDALEYKRTGNVPEAKVDVYNRYYKDRYASAKDYFLKSAHFLDKTVDELVDLKKAFEEFPAVERTINSIPDEVIKGMFGDHVAVIITKDGVEVEDYDHD